MLEDFRARRLKLKVAELDRADVRNPRRDLVELAVQSGHGDRQALVVEGAARNLHQAFDNLADRPAYDQDAAVRGEPRQQPPPRRARRLSRSDAWLREPRVHIVQTAHV